MELRILWDTEFFLSLGGDGRSYEPGGASGRPRTPDPLLTKQPLCQLSYTSIEKVKRTAEAVLSETSLKISRTSLLYFADTVAAPQNRHTQAVYTRLFRREIAALESFRDG